MVSVYVSFWIVEHFSRAVSFHEKKKKVDILFIPQVWDFITEVVALQMQILWTLL